MPGDDWRKFANLRLLLGFLYTVPGKKDVFMGTELGSFHPWDPAVSLDWHLKDHPRNAGLARWLRDLNTIYRATPALHASDARSDGFTWVDLNDRKNCVVSYLRRWDAETLLVVANFTAEPRRNYRVGVPASGKWEEILNGDAPLYGGSGQGNMGGVTTAPVPWHGHPQSLNLTLPPLSVVALKAPER
jgi:1,4-alpha-glucan branching enzyme